MIDRKLRSSQNLQRNSHRMQKCIWQGKNIVTHSLTSPPPHLNEALSTMLKNITIKIQHGRARAIIAEDHGTNYS